MKESSFSEILSKMPNQVDHEKTFMVFIGTECLVQNLITNLTV